MEIQNRNYYLNANKQRNIVIKELDANENNNYDIPEYIDADKRLPINKQLYIDYKDKILNQNDNARIWKIENKEREYKIYFNEKKKFLFTTDYIGPSRSWVTDDLIIDPQKREVELLKYEDQILEQSRVLAGHIIWPTYNSKYTTNQSRGGNGFYDRIDCTFELLKIFMDNQCYNWKNIDNRIISKLLKTYPEYKEAIISKKVYSVFKSFYRYKEYYKILESFKKFCELHSLIGNFVIEDNGELKVVNLQPKSSLIPITKPNLEYTRNNLEKIKQRQMQIFE